MSRRLPGSIHPDWHNDHVYRGPGSNDMPANPRPGQLHYPAHGPNSGEDPEWFAYDDAKSKWLSLSRIHYEGVYIGNTAATNPLWIDYISAATVKFGAGVGYPAPYDLELVSMSCQVATSSTCTFSVYANNAVVTGATLSLAAATSAQSDGYTTATITKGQYIGFYVTAGTANVGGTVKATFARVVS